jgi:hypothetical protein
MILGKTGNPGRDTFQNRGHDFYETPPQAVRALLKAEPLPERIWEPACGSGAIVKVLRDAGHIVMATDLQNAGCHDSRFGIDFLMELQAPIGCECVVTNPPFKLAGQFIRHALDLVPKVVMLLRFNYLEGITRSDIIDESLTRVHLFRNRLPMMHRRDWAGPRATSMVAFAWFVWLRGHTGAITLNRVTWE